MAESAPPEPRGTPPGKETNVPSDGATQVMDAMETQQRRWTMAVGTAISVGVATLVSSATRIR